MSHEYLALRAKFANDGELARALFTLIPHAMVAMREACIDAMVSNSDDKMAIEAMHAIQPADILAATSDSIVDLSNATGINLVIENAELRKQLAEKDHLLAFEDFRLRRLAARVAQKGLVNHEQRRA